MNNWFYTIGTCMFILQTQALDVPIIDLQDLDDGTVIQTTQIHVPDYPYAFNPSIISLHDKFLLSFRVIPNKKQSFCSWLGLIWLDNAFKPIGKAQRLYTRNPHSKIPSRLEEGRLITANNNIYLVYSDNNQQKINKTNFRLHIAKITYNGSKFFITDQERITSFPFNRYDQREKNWVPFCYNNNLMLAYSLCPHIIFKPWLKKTGHCQLFCVDKTMLPWHWGAPRGGTPALLDGDEYLAFFHSSKKMATVHSQGKEEWHYFIGAYTFKKEPPFRITKISMQPIIGPVFYDGPIYEPYWKPVHVVFPCGFVIQKDTICVAYGRQDHELWIAYIDKKKLYKHMITI